MFPFTLSGWVTVRGVRDPESAAPLMRERVIDMLENAYASSVWREDNGDVRFTAGVFRSSVWNWNILLPFGSGRVRVVPRRRSVLVSYRLSTMQLFLSILVMLALIAIVTFTPGHFEQWTANLPWIAVLMFGWLFGANYLIGLIRFPIWLRVGLMRTPPANSLKAQMLHSLRD